MKHLNLKNGITVSVIDDGYGKESGLFEVAAWMTNSDPFVSVTQKIWRRKADGEDTIGWLTKEEVKEFISDAKKIKLIDLLDRKKKPSNAKPKRKICKCKK